MFKPSTKTRLATKMRLALGLAFTASLGAILTGGSAGADPQQYAAAVGVGSGTVQDVMNAFAGFTNGTQYTPVNSGSSVTQFRQIISFDAVPPAGVIDNCITTKLGGPTYFRPNGSGAGRKALFASSGLSALGWTGGGGCGTAQDISGQVDFARSSSGPAVGDLLTDQTYIPFGRDGVSYAAYRAAGSPVTTLTRAQLTTLFTTGAQTIGGVRIVPCGIQTSSGTFTFWNTVTTATLAQEAAATTECNNLLGVNVRAEENDGTALKTRGDALAAVAGHAGDQVVIGFSAASFIAKSNLAAPGLPPAAVQMGTISDLGGGNPPVSGTAPNLTPTTAFYNDTVVGRNVFSVLPTSVATGPGNAAMKALFVGTGSAVCSATTTITKFGFLTIGAGCGSTALKGAWTQGAS